MSRHEFLLLAMGGILMSAAIAVAGGFSRLDAADLAALRGGTAKWCIASGTAANCKDKTLPSDCKIVGTQCHQCVHQDGWKYCFLNNDPNYDCTETYTSPFAYCGEYYYGNVVKFNCTCNIKKNIKCGQQVANTVTGVVCP